jgi:hypothetical protein
VKVAPEEVRAQLERIVASHAFASSARMSRFLRFSVEEMLAGHADELKEITIGISVFDRSPDYDSRLDPIVRVEARRLREKLSRYYETDGQEDPIIIDLPRGGYTPLVRQRIDPAAGEDAKLTEPAEAGLVPATVDDALKPDLVVSARRHRFLALGAIAAIVGLIALGITTMIGPNAGAMRERDSLVLGEIVNRTGEPVFD